MVLCFTVTFFLMNDSDYFKLKGYNIGKVVNSAEKYKKSDNPYKLTDEIINIKKKYNVDIVKFTNFKKDNYIHHQFTYFDSKKNFNNYKCFNKKMLVSQQSKKIEDKNIVGIYLFSTFNKDIEKALSNLGLTVTDYKVPPITQRITLIIYENYFYILLFVLLIYTLILAYKLSSDELIFSELVKKIIPNKFYIIFLSTLNIIFLIYLWLYNQWSNILQFIGYYICFSIISILVFIFLFFFMFSIFKNKYVTKLKNILDVHFYLFVQSICIFILYLILLLFSSVNNEIYLSYIKNPLNSVKQYTTTDLTSFSPEFYTGERKVNNYYKNFISNQKDIIISAYNVGYSFKTNNYDPYSGNSFLVSPKYFDTQIIHDNKGNIFKFNETKENNTVRLIIPFNKKSDEEKIKEKYTKWMNFISGIPTKKLNVKIFYSKDNQYCYSYGYQNDIKSLKLKSPVIMVINPMSLTAEETATLMSNRFISFIQTSNPKQAKYYNSYFAEINQLKYLISSQSHIWLVKWITLVLILILLSLIILKIDFFYTNTLDRLIWNIISLTFIIYFFPFKIYSYLIIIVLMFYLFFKSKFKKNKFLNQ